jgi:glyoxylase-like metal-dependent hydrolase (beta-lactamase superfamily II)
LTVYNDEFQQLHPSSQGVGTAVFRDLTAYMASLQRMKAVVEKEGIKILFPAHGPVIEVEKTKF